MTHRLPSIIDKRAGGDWYARVVRIQYQSAAITMLALLLNGCARPQAQALPAYSGWMNAMQRGDYIAARNLLTGSSAARWYTETLTLEQRHGSIVELIGGGGTQGGLRPYEATIRLTCQDGYQRCIRLSETVARELYIQGNGYLDCAQIPSNLLPSVQSSPSPARVIPTTPSPLP